MSNYEMNYMRGQNNNNSNASLEGVVDWISDHKFLVIAVLSIIPILVFIIIGFKNNHYILGSIGISFAITLFICVCVDTNDAFTFIDNKFNSVRHHIFTYVI